MALVAAPVAGQDATVYVEDETGATSGYWDGIDGEQRTLSFFIVSDPWIDLWGYQINGPCAGDGDGVVTYVASTVEIDTTRPDFRYVYCVYWGCQLFTNLDQGDCGVGDPPRMAAITGGTVNPDWGWFEMRLCGCPIGQTCLLFDEGKECTDDSQCESLVGHEYDGACFELKYAGQMDYECPAGSAGFTDNISAHPTDGFLQNPDGTYYTYATAGYDVTCSVCTDDSQCDDGEPCTAGVCDPVSGCDYLPYGAPYGDVTDLGGDCPADPDDYSGCGTAVGLPDIGYVLRAFRMGDAWADCFPNADLASALADPCERDGSVGLPDIWAVVEAFKQNYLCESACPCVE